MGKMGQVVCHMDKAKKGSSGGLTIHIDRTEEYNPLTDEYMYDEQEEHIYPNKTIQNFELVNVTGTIDQMINQRIDKGYKDTKAMRRDAVTSCRFILSGSHEQMAKIGENPKAIKEWAQDSYNFYAKMYGEENIVRATVHMDEKTPHMHLIVVPLTKEGKMSAYQFTGTKAKLRNMQTDYAKEVGAKWGLERGTPNSGKKHIESKAFYKYLDANEVDAQWMIDHPNSKELIATLLAENDKLRGTQKEKVSDKSNNKNNYNNESNDRLHRTNQQSRETKQTKTDRKPRKGLNR